MDNQFLSNSDIIEEEPFYCITRTESFFQFDYEINDITVKEADGKYIAIDNSNSTEIDFDQFEETKKETSFEGKAGQTTPMEFKANCIKRLVSKSKRRIRNEYFDLDMSYITPRVIVMGFPSVGFESLFRNSLHDVQNFLSRYHKRYKIYNLCLERGRIYNKESFDNCKVALFPFIDRDPCPIRLILEFCIDICLLFLKDKETVAVIHCKAGKGRSGIMAICYLIFAGLCRESTEAVDYFASQRTRNRKGVTIPSQLRYIRYFETFLSSHFNHPYYRLIPKIIGEYRISQTTNMLLNYQKESNQYFTTHNHFILKRLKIGPFKSNKAIACSFSALSKKTLKFINAVQTMAQSQLDQRFYLTIDFNTDLSLDYDICLKAKGFAFFFYCWVNLYYSTLDNLTEFIIKNQLAKKSLSSLTTASAEPNSLKESLGGSLSFANLAYLCQEETNENNDINSNKNNDEIIMVSSLSSSSSSNPFNSNENEVKSKPNQLKPKEKFFNLKSSLIAIMMHCLRKNNDLLYVINEINRVSKSSGIKDFNTEEQVIKLEKEQLDKFKDTFGSIDEALFSVELVYSIKDNNN